MFSATQQYASCMNRQTVSSCGKSSGRSSSSRMPRKAVARTSASLGDFFSASSMFRLRVRPSANFCSTSTSTEFRQRTCRKTGSTTRRSCLVSSDHSSTDSPPRSSLSSCATLFAFPTPYFSTSMPARARRSARASSSGSASAVRATAAPPWQAAAAAPSAGGARSTLEDISGGGNLTTWHARASAMSYHFQKWVVVPTAVVSVVAKSVPSGSPRPAKCCSPASWMSTWTWWVLYMDIRPGYDGESICSTSKW
mmetsp:Transcript_91201/g.254732  ORF Transcript_91201/g.254732 Transcript_91201/m.254732 type:complete len:253 (+) Transcript_91201:1220-1978(+)